MKIRILKFSIFVLFFALPLFSKHAYARGGISPNELLSPDFQISSNIKNLYYSQKNRAFYFSIPSTVTEKAGLYYFSESDAVLKRLYCPTMDEVVSASDRYVRYNSSPDYQAFFNYLYSFADSGTDPVFATQDASGDWLYEEYAFLYLTGYSEEKGWGDNYGHFYHKNSVSDMRFRLEKFLYDRNKGFINPVSAFSYNGHPEAIDSLWFSNIPEGFFVENAQGVFYMARQADGAARLFSFLTADNQLKFEPVIALNNYHLDYFKVTISPDKNLFIFNDKNVSNLVFDCSDETVLEFSNTADFKKYLSKRDFTEYPRFKLYRLLIIVLFVIIFVLLAVAFVPKLIFVLNQLNPKKRRYNFTQKELNQKVFNIQENERKKISRDIHDTVIQDIRVLGIEADLIKLPQDDKANGEHKQKIQQIATDCIIKLRNICYNLAPAELSGHTEDDSSKIQLISMLNTLSSQFSIRTHIPCSVKVKDDFNYPPFERQITENIFRVVQEALNNVEKHSYATAVSIFIKSKIIDEKEYLIIYISDDGVGFDAKHLNLKNNSHLGLRNMKERMDLIGGKIEFFSKPNEGLEITLTIAI